jgi:hypothetical protein
MPASRTDSKSPRNRRREQGSPIDGGAEFDDITTNNTATTNILTDEQIKLRAMIPAITVRIIFYPFLHYFPSKQTSITACTWS